MHPHNRLDGANEILGAWAKVRSLGVDPAFPGPIAGHLQHDPDAACPEALTGETSFVWSETVRTRLPPAARSRSVVIGSPWAYALELPTTGPAVPDYLTPEEQRQRARRDFERTRSGQKTDEEREVDEPRGAVIFPRHGIFGALLAHDIAAALKSGALGHLESVTVVLDAADAAVGAVRRTYERTGLAVTSLAPRLRPVGASGPNRLEQLRQLIRGTRLVASNVVHPWFLYAASAGVPVRIAGPAPSDVTPTGPLANEVVTLLDDRTALEQLSTDVVGIPAVLAPEELQALFDWRRR